MNLHGSFLVHCGIIGILIFAVVGSGRMFADRHRSELERIHAAAKTAQMESTRKSWQGLIYGRADVARLIAEVEGNPAWKSMALSVVQAASLNDALSDSLEYVFTPEMDEYLQLRTSRGRYQFELNPSLANALVTTNLLGVSILPSDMAGVVRELWRRRTLGPAGQFGERIDGVAYDTVAVAISHDPSTLAVLKGGAGRGQTGAMLAMNPGFSHGSGDTNRVETYFHLGFLAKSSAPDGVGPVHMSLKWIEEEETWVPDRLFTDVLLKFTTMF